MKRTRAVKNHVGDSYPENMMHWRRHWLKCTFNYISLTLSPALIKKSTRTDFSFVWPDLKSSPPMKIPRWTASSTAPGTKVFWGEPLMYAQPSRILATANRVDGDTSPPFYKEVSLKWLTSTSRFLKQASKFESVLVLVSIVLFFFPFFYPIWAPANSQQNTFPVMCQLPRREGEA